MRRLVAALAIAVVAVSLAGCGGGDAAPPPEASATAVPTATPAPANPTGDRDSLSPTLTILPGAAYPEPWPTTLTKSNTPKEVQANLDADQPMLIVFSDSKQLVTADQKVEINAVMKEYSGLIDTVVIDIVEGFPESGETTDTKLANAMAKDLQVSFTPYMIFVDRYGRITWRFNGYTDRKLLEREILRATQ